MDTLEEYSLFSGMFCAVTGTNPTGAAFVVEKIQSFDFGLTEDISEIKIEPHAKIQNTSKNFVLCSYSHDCYFSGFGGFGALLHVRFTFK